MTIKLALRYAIWSNLVLTAYLWLIDLGALGNWNYQHDPHLIDYLLAGGKLHIADVSFLLFITVPAIASLAGWYQQNRLFYIVALIFDVIWLVLQILSWRVLYIVGTNKQWQLDYSHSPTTKIFPSFGNHVAPDGMHLLITVLLLVAIYFTVRLLLTSGRDVAK